MPALLIAIGCLTPLAAEEISPIDRHELHHGAHLPQDRDYSRQVDLAEELIKQSRYSEAIPLLLQMLANPHDVFDLAAGDADEAPRSLRRRVRRLLSDLPPAGQRAYELETAEDARRRLRDALDSGDQTAAERLVRRYPQSASRGDALWLLAWLARDRGDLERALSVVERLRQFDQRGEFEPQRSLLEASVLLESGRATEARGVITDLTQSPHAQTTLTGGIPLSDAEAVWRWLSQSTATMSVGMRGPDRWTARGGGRRGNPVRAGGEPHLWARWAAVAVADPQQHVELLDHATALQTERRAMAPARQPIAVGDVVVMRSDDHLIAIDWRTGRRIWETRAVLPETPQPTPASRVQWNRAAWQRQAQQAPLSNEVVRTWFDLVANNLGADEQRIYAIEPVKPANQTPQDFRPFAARQRNSRFGFPTPRNRLAAYDLSTEGKLAWFVGAGQPGELATAYFLCAPLRIGDRLVTLAELDQTVCLIELTPATGALRWRQPLVSVERGVDQNPMRRLVGGAIAAQGDLVVCSTGSGVVAAVDLLERDLAWIDRFPVEEGRQAIDALPWQRRPRDVWPKNAENHWLENRVVIADDRVLVASPESPQLHCLDLGSGQPLWRADRQDAALLMAVADETVLVAEPQAIVARSLATGEQRRWRHTWDGDAVLAGRGVVVGDRLLTPLSDDSLLVTAVADGRSERSRVWSGAGLGNLILHRGAVVSQTHESLDRYDQLDALIQSAERSLATDAGDVEALCVRGEVLLSNGRLDDAISAFKAAREAQPDSRLAWMRLRDAVSLRLSDSGPNATDLALLEELVEVPGKRMALKSLAIELALKDGRLTDAIDRAEEMLAAPDAGQTLLRVAEGHYALPSRRAGGLLDRAWSAASQADRAAAAGAVMALRSDRDSVARQTRFLELFGGLPSVGDAGRLVGDARRQLLATVEAEGRRLEAEFLRAAEAPYEPPRSPTPAADPRWTTQQIAAAIGRREPSPANRRRPPRAGLRRVQLANAEPTGGDGRFVDAAINLDTNELIGVDRFGVPTYRAELTSASFGLLRQVKSNQKTVITRFGPCLYLQAGEQLTALDTLAGIGGDRRLWSTEGVVQELTRAGRDLPSWRRKAERVAPPPDAEAPVKLIGATAAGVVVRKDSALVCLDPLSGELLWARHDHVFPKQTVCDDRYVYTTLTSGRGLKLSMQDGGDAGNWSPPQGEWLWFHNGVLATLLKETKEITLRVINIKTNQPLLVRTFAKPLQVATVDDREVALLGHDGHLVLINKRSGTVSVDTALPLRRAPVSVEVAERFGRLVVTVGYALAKQASNRRTTALDTGRVVVGEVHCLDRATGEPAWPRPVQIANRGWLLRQPRDSPLLVFGAQQRTSRRGQPAAVHLLVVDVMSGRTVHRSEPIKDIGQGVYQVRYQAAPSPRLDVLLANQTLTLRPTDAPAPPSPPAADGVESPADAASMGNVVRQFSRALEGAIQAQPADQGDD